MRSAAIAHEEAGALSEPKAQDKIHVKRFLAVSMLCISLGLAFSSAQITYRTTPVLVVFCVIVAGLIGATAWFARSERVPWRTMVRLFQLRPSYFAEPRVKARWPFLTGAFLLIHILIYALMVNDGGVHSALWHDLTMPYCIDCYCLRTDWDWNKVIGSSLLNFPPPYEPYHFHLIGNMLCLAIFGFYLEAMIGRLAMVVLYLGTLLTNAYLYCACAGVGTSGVVYAFMGALWACLFALRSIRWYDTTEPVAWRLGCLSIYLTLVLVIFSCGCRPSTAHDAHGIGFIFGLLVTLGMGYMVTLGRVARPWQPGWKKRVFGFFMPEPEENRYPVPGWHWVLTMAGIVLATAFTVLGYLYTFEKWR